MSILTNQWRNKPAVRRALLAGLAIIITASLGGNAIIAGPIILAVTNYYMCGDNKECQAEILPTIPVVVQKLIK